MSDYFTRPPLTREEILAGHKAIKAHRALLKEKQDAYAALHDEIRGIESRISTFERVHEVFEGVPLAAHFDHFSLVSEDESPHRIARVWMNANTRNKPVKLWGFETGYSGTMTNVGSQTTFHGSGWSDEAACILTCKRWVAHGRLELPPETQHRW